MKTSLGQKINIFKHASERIKERLIDDLVRKTIISAFEDGEELTEEQAKIQFNKGLYQNKYWSSIYRVYEKRLYIFRKTGKAYTLITIL